MNIIHLNEKFYKYNYGKIFFNKEMIKINYREKRTYMKLNNFWNILINSIF